MMIPMKESASLSALDNTCMELKGEQGASLLLPSPVEPLNPLRSISLGVKERPHVKHIKYGLNYTGGRYENRLSLRRPNGGKLSMRNAKREELSTKTRITCWSLFFRSIECMISLEVF